MEFYTKTGNGKLITNNKLNKLSKLTQQIKIYIKGWLSLTDEALPEGTARVVLMGAM